MNINIEYVNGALRTESPVTSEMAGRFINPGLVIQLLNAMLANIVNGNDMDRLKRHLFYDTPLDVNMTQVVSVPKEIQARLSNPATIRLLHAVMGLATEVTEMFEHLHAHIFEGAPLDRINLIEEGGDEFWYLAIYADTLSVTFNDMMERNHRKLRARYPDNFASGQALTRDLGVERAKLEASYVPGTYVVNAIAVTMNGAKVKIVHFDNDHGYAFGYIDGDPYPHTWWIPDGWHTSKDRINNALDLNMETLQEVPK